MALFDFSGRYQFCFMKGLNMESEGMRGHKERAHTTWINRGYFELISIGFMKKIVYEKKSK